MPKDFFQRNIDLMNQLRSQHFKYTQYINKGKYKLKQKFFGKGKKHYDFDINSQEYFHQQIQDIAFESTQTQEEFFNLVNGAMNLPFKVQNTRKQCSSTNRPLLTLPLSISNPSQCRALLSKHFFARVHNLRYKKYLILSRYHNCQSQKKQIQVLPFVESRTLIMEKEIQTSINRQMRLGEQDYFQEAFTQGGKPIPISQTGQPIYKYLDQQQCWYSNIAREDIIVYTRNTQFKRQLLNQVYYPLQSEIQALVFRDGLQIMLNVEEDIHRNVTTITTRATKMAQQFNLLLQKQLEIISPGNLVQKQNITNFGYTIFGILQNHPLSLPLYPATYPQLFQTFNYSTQLFFRNLKFKTHQNIISLLPKLNSFCQILFKYQNHEILQDKRQIKLGLEDDIDVRKQLYTMLQQVWVRRHVTLAFQRFDYKLQLKPIDWPLQSISEEVSRRNKRNNPYQKVDTSVQQLIKLLSFTDFLSFRRNIKKRAQKIVSRAQTKYFDMQKINHYNKKSAQKMTLQQISQLFKVKFDNNHQEKQHFLKPNAYAFFTQIMSKFWIVNPAQIQIQETLKFLKIRQDRVKIMNVLNGIRCYHRNLCLDLRVLTGEQFKFKLDDEFLINSNKQVVQSFEKAIKQTATFFTKNSNDNKEKKVNAQFNLPQNKYQESILYKKDVISCHYYNNGPLASNDQKNSTDYLVPHVIVSNGRRLKSKILYGIVIQTDLPLIQQRILEHSTKVINQYERYIKTTSRQEIIDRVQLIHIFFQLQLRFLYAKFRLIERYYYLYENTTSVLDAFKISKIIVQLIHKKPELQVQSMDSNIIFEDIYQNHIQALQQEEGILSKMTQMLKKQQQRKVQTFHKRFCQNYKVPLSAQIYLYRDLQLKQKSKNKLQRANSISSKHSSKSSKGVYHKNNLALNQKIREQFYEDSNDEQSFDIQNYDQYLLKKDMDAIFEDMIQVDQNKDSLPINTTALQNIVINPRFQGGPHPYNFSIQQVKITSQNKENLLNFYQSLAFASNVREMINKLQVNFIGTYGYVSKNYQSFLLKMMVKMINKILLQPIKSVKKWKQFQSCDPYHQIVTICSKHYQQVMGAALDPPSNIQMAIASTLQRHQQKLPPISTLSAFDYYSIQSLVCLRKPVNSASYRQLALGINYLTFLNIRQSMFHIQLKRQRTIESYQKLASNCGSVAERYGAMYSRSGQSDVLLAIQEIRQYKEQLYAYPVLPEIIQELNIFILCENADTQLFKTIVTASKIKLEDYIIMKNQVGKKFVNSRFDNDRLLAKDQKTIKMIKNRLNGQISNICQDQFKNNSFIKIKQKLKIKVQKLIKQVSEADVSQKLVFPKQKLSQYSKSLLQDKLKRKLVFQIIQAYYKDLTDTNVRNKVFVETNSMIKRLRKLINCAPYLRQHFVLAPNQQNMERKVFYDQKKKSGKDTGKVQTGFVRQGKVVKPFYIYSRQQLCDEWSSQETLFRANNLNEFSIHSIDFSPPKQKNLLFKWLYKIPECGFAQHERKAFQHFIGKLCLPFTGKSSQSQYLSLNYQSDAPINRFYTIYCYYQTLLEYLQSNFLLISLQMQDDVLESFDYLLSNDNIIFEQLFPLRDQVSIHESLASLQKKYLKTCFNYKQSRQTDKMAIKSRIQAKGYLRTQQHWTVYDEILDFIVSKVQGRGVMRQNFLPFIKEIQELFAINSGANDVQQLLSIRTDQINHYFFLSTSQAYLNEQHQNTQVQSSFFNYLFPIYKWFLGNALQNYGLAQKSKNLRYNISSVVNQDQRELQRFVLGLSNSKNNNLTKMNTIIDKYRSVLLVNKSQIEKYIEDLLKQRISLSANKLLSQSESGKNNNSVSNNVVVGKGSSGVSLYNFNFLPQGVKLFQCMGQTNRLKIFARMRYYHQKSGQYMKLKTMVTKPLQIEQTKLSYLKFLLSSKTQSLSTVVFAHIPDFPVSSKDFKEESTQLKQVIEINTFKIFDKFDQYKSQNKIQFGKSEIKLLNATEQVRKDDKLRTTYNSMIRQIIQSKLTRQQFKSRVLLESIKILRCQKIQQVQVKKIINTSLIPRVHLIASYSSPLILQRKTYISQQYKLAFAQAFINRFRNKVSRVDLLSSGYGFVITVPDLQDCVNFMNKLLFTFAEKQFKYRLQTYQQYFDIMVEAVNQKNKVIKQQQQINKFLKQKVQNIMQAEYLGKVTNILHQKTVVEDKLRLIQQSTNGLQDRIRKTVEIQYERKITSLETQNQLLKNKFNQFKELFVILTKDSAKNNFLNVANTIRQKIEELLNKRIDVKESFLTDQENRNGQKDPTKTKFQKTKFQGDEGQIKGKRQESKQSIYYTSQDLLSCKLGQDIIHDPYYTTKLITKMRLFNIFKLGCKKIHFQEVQNTKTSELKQLHKIQDTVIAQSERQISIRQQLKRTQQEMSRKVAQYQRLKQSYDLLDNQKTKLKILLAGKDKKIEQKEREVIENMKRLQQVEKLPTLPASQGKIERAQCEKPRISQLRKIHKKNSTKIQKSPFVTNIPVQPSISIYDRFELSNKDATWRQKCEQLYIQNKKLTNELQKLQKTQTGLTTPTRDGYSLNLRQRKRSQSFNLPSDSTSVRKQDQQKRFPNLSFKYNLMKQTPTFNP